MNNFDPNSKAENQDQEAIKDQAAQAADTQAAEQSGEEKEEGAGALVD
jgi:hypothetical protein